jgi:tRNA(Ile)-lysidine synthase
MSSSATQCIVQAIQAQLSELEACRELFIAYSGGVDSHVLLHALAYYRPIKLPVSAIHVHHGLLAEADSWAEHCRDVCASLGVTCQVLWVNAQAATGESPEAAARQARYHALREFLPEDSVVLSAHQQDDQAETLLLQLLRGAGLRGLASMPAQASLGKAQLLRPLLSITRAQITEYARAHQLSWLEDPSNRDEQLDRNYLRRQIIPHLLQRWPSARATIARSAQHCAQAEGLLQEMASEDLSKVRMADNSLVIDQLSIFSEPRLLNLLRYWITQSTLPLPSRALLLRIIYEVVTCRVDAMPLIQWAGAEVRRYRNRLFIMSPLSQLDSHVSLSWDGQQPLVLPANLGQLQCMQVLGQGICLEKLRGQSLQVSFAEGGERLHPVGRQGSHPLKKLWQEWGVPPWMRARIPLVFSQGELIAVAGYAIKADWQVGPDELGCVFTVTE